MGINTEYLIPFKGLENGVHKYRFQVSTEFFLNFENSRIKKGNYIVDLIFDKRDLMMILDFSFHGDYQGSCDRCLTIIDIPNEGNDQIIVKFQNDVTLDSSQEVVIIEDDAHEIDVSSFINNMIHLHLPLVNKRNCEEEEYKFCDHSLLDKLERTQEDGDEGREPGTNWDALKDLNLD